MAIMELSEAEWALHEKLSQGSLFALSEKRKYVSSLRSIFFRADGFLYFLDGEECYSDCRQQPTE
ncbi:unnamed protein product, partial [Amoebophrya sp. A120]|eukprot:GSA120T00024597001.1